MAHEELISALIQGIRDCDSLNGSYIYVSRNDAVQLIRILTGDMAEETLKRMETGQKQFYCPDCSVSFWADPTEDGECFQKWQYHIWYAGCPRCGKQIVQNDRYWR